MPCRIQFGDTADYKSALRLRGRFLHTNAITTRLRCRAGCQYSANRRRSTTGFATMRNTKGAVLRVEQSSKGRAVPGTGGLALEQRVAPAAAAAKVAQSCTLLYRGFAIRMAHPFPVRRGLTDALPNAIRRYSRLQICATTSRPFPAHECYHNPVALSGRVSIFCQPEAFDHWIRNDEEYERCCRYVVNNPVKARLCPAPEEWRWSSVCRQRQPPPK